ncbi:MAG: ABC transporter ATP-binding protein [Desulfobacterales bacterium]|nr:MAG: ABC transporter ATP-binding protein [Desulfobacterales bacterium]UCD89475.1 MAG: ABC transporter ATP-binding protein [Desulfobacterales bacterium]
MEKNDLIVHLENITFSYPGCKPILEKLNLRFFKKERIGLMGPNGSGKTTLFHIIMGLLKPSAGKIEIFNTPAESETDFRNVREKIGLLFQDADDQLFSPTVLEDVAFGPLNLGKTKDDAMKIARNTLSFLGLNDFENRITYKLSGGEKRLVSLATVLAMEPEALLLDEPTNGLDDKTRLTLKRVLSNLDLSFIIISHDIDFLHEITDSIYTLEKGKILFDQEVHVHQHIHAHPHGAYTHEHK